MIKPNTFLNNLWLKSVGEKEDWSWLIPRPMPTMESILKTEWCPEFERLVLSDLPILDEEFLGYCHNRMVMGALRYGLIKDQDFLEYDLPSEIKKRVAKARATKNSEGQIDAWNMCMLMYIATKDTVWVTVGESIYIDYVIEGFPLIAEDDGEHSAKKS